MRAEPTVSKIQATIGGALAALYGKLRNCGYSRNRPQCLINSVKMDAQIEYAIGTTRSEIPLGSVSDALRTLVNDHILTKAQGGRSRYRLDDPLFEEWLRRERGKLLGQKNR